MIGYLYDTIISASLVSYLLVVFIPLSVAVSKVQETVLSLLKEQGTESWFYALACSFEKNVGGGIVMSQKGYTYGVWGPVCLFYGKKERPDIADIDIDIDIDIASP